MSALRKLQQIQQDNKSMICLGLDLDTKRMPQDYCGSIKGMFDFANKIIEATSDSVCAYKPNLAFYESLGAEGLSLLKLILERIPENIPIILDGKRGDISNTASHYAHLLFDILKGDWVTLNPYMGYDSMRPFLEYKDKGVFVLCLTSNAGSKDFQLLQVDGKPLYQIVAEKVSYWNKEQNCGLVIGATHPDQLDEIRDIARDMPLLIPGVGAQGGALEKAALSGTANFTKVAVINVSRSVLYASTDKDFAVKAREELDKLNVAVNGLRENALKPKPEQNQQPGQGQNQLQSNQNQQPNQQQQYHHGQNPQHQNHNQQQYQNPNQHQNRNNPQPGEHGAH
ncbi:MAG: orotidine-5'-phosphate decarboxylase [Candidatus Zixiibacteriota bacterium]